MILLGTRNFEAIEGEKHIPHRLKDILCQNLSQKETDQDIRVVVVGDFKLSWRFSNAYSNPGREE